MEDNHEGSASGRWSMPWRLSLIEQLETIKCNDIDRYSVADVIHDASEGRPETQDDNVPTVTHRYIPFRSPAFVHGDAVVLALVFAYRRRLNSLSTFVKKLFTRYNAVRGRAGYVLCSEMQVGLVW